MHLPPKASSGCEVSNPLHLGLALLAARPADQHQPHVSTPQFGHRLDGDIRSL